jgi:hypothetical protein
MDPSRTALSGILHPSFPPKIPPSLENWNAHAAHDNLSPNGGWGKLTEHQSSALVISKGVLK